MNLKLSCRADTVSRNMMRQRGLSLVRGLTAFQKKMSKNDPTDCRKYDVSLR